MNIDKKTMELLLVNYKNLHNSMSHFKPCADQTESKTTQLDMYYEFEDEFGDMEELKKSTIEADPDIEYTDEWCSCGHRKLDCDCKAGCKCGCNKRFLRAY